MEHLLVSGETAGLDRHFARFICRLADRESPGLMLAGLLVSRRTGEGHVCLDLEEYAGRTVFNAPAQGKIVCPELPDWRGQLTGSGVVGKPGDFSPLILTPGNRLYLHRYWEYETRIAERIKDWAGSGFTDIDFPMLGRGLARFFPSPPADEPDWRKIAAVSAATRPLCIITGGPGTGKTTTVARILALLLEQSAKTPRIALAASTGKAANRLQEAINNAGASLPCPPAIKTALPDKASTLHRLLQSVHGSPYFKFNADNPLPFEIVVIDEASMVDLPLMAKLFAAIPADGRLILLGDRDQLASVEPGAVLGDICHPDAAAFFSGSFRKKAAELIGGEIPAHPPVSGIPGLADSIVELKVNYRFGRQSGIHATGRSVKRGDPDDVLGIINDPGFPDINWRAVSSPDELKKLLAARLKNIFTDHLETGDPDTAFQAFNRFRILCALRNGPFGVENINRLVEKELYRDVISHKHVTYQGKPLMITRNDYRAGLYNGDLGIVLPDPEADNELRCFFADRDGYRKISTHRLPPHETAFAITVHKSQGSEFDNVLLVLPNQFSPVLTRELLYTAITRAGKTVEIWGNTEVLKASVAACISRKSGLRAALWE